MTEFYAQNDVSEEAFLSIRDRLDYEKTKKSYVPRFEKKKKKPQEITDQPRRKRSAPKFDVAGGIVRILIFVAVFALVIFALFVFVSRIGKGDKKVDSTSFEDIENIEDIDAEKGLKLALKDLDYRNAIRMKFIQCLQSLEQNKLIKWRPEKTNRDYVREISDKQLRDQFRDLAGYFEFSWYGNHPVTASEFTEIDQKFNSFKINPEP